jgi:acyl-CoA thioester hydrolase
MSMQEGVLSETYRSVVAAWECDVMGHLTIAFYFDRFADAAASLIERVAPAKAPASAAWRSTRLLTRYQKELRAGDGILIRSGVIGRDGGGIRLGHELLRPDGGEACTLVEHTLMPRELPYGGQAEQRRVLTQAPVPWSTPGFDDIAPPTRREGMVDSGRDRVKAWELDERGELSLSGYVHRFAHACLHVCAAFGMTTDYMRAERRGFSTFETRLELAAPPPGAGDPLVLRSGLLKAGNSSLHMLHEMRQARTGELLATFHQAGVHFDLEARRSAALPPALRSRAQSLVIA